ncbi:VOC family protein [Saccharopolyspora sp. K220]|uniref:VOC family protein n=1 Tax=Saccharopolyspora soli TaxID=2926618 RepID=UPI001F5A25E9|nr:VOC family protein [Saccharopolyspora soli]MCI2417851.1 VOC family protein [Saccharopolyspora soli]
MTESPKIQHLEIGCRDLSRSLEFYQGLLGFQTAVDVAEPQRPDVRWLDAGAARLRLVEIADGDLGGWSPDDLQCGLRHFGMKVGDVDAQAGRLLDAGVRFTKEPKDAHGGVRITFFTDPDGTLLEFVEGHLEHDKTWSPELAELDRVAHRDRPRDAGPTFDHVAVSAPNLEAALEFYVGALHATVIGQLFFEADPRGFVITNLQVGPAVVELFTFAEQTEPNPWSPDNPRVGLRTIGLGASDPNTAIDAMTAAGAGPVLEATPTGQLLADPHGLPLTVVTAR